jgi:hypothetical protein
MGYCIVSVAGASVVSDLRREQAGGFLVIPFAAGMSQKPR